MATFLDFSILEGASSVFGFLLVFALTFGLLKFSGLFKQSEGVNALIAFCFALMSAFSPAVMEVIKVVTPWYTLLMYLVIIILVIIMIFGGLGDTVGDIKGNMGSYYKTVVTWIVVISIIIFISGVSSVFLGGANSEYSLNNGEDPYLSVEAGANGGDFADTDGKGSDAFLDNLFHPKVIGMILFLVLAGVAVMLLGYTSVKPS